MMKYFLILLSLPLTVISQEDYSIRGLKNGHYKADSSYIYDLPFEKGTKHKIVQGYGGLFSHKNIAALDFDMPVGTPVCAAREGVIYAYKDDSDEGGIFPGYEKWNQDHQSRNQVDESIDVNSSLNG